MAKEKKAEKKAKTEEKRPYRALKDGTIELFAPHNQVRKFSSKKLASIAGRVLADPDSATPEELRALAASVLSQTKDAGKEEEVDKD